jgi:hypothetical protein
MTFTEYCHGRRQTMCGMGIDLWCRARCDTASCFLSGDNIATDDEIVRNWQMCVKVFALFCVYADEAAFVRFIDDYKIVRLYNC